MGKIHWVLNQNEAQPGAQIVCIHTTHVHMDTHAYTHIHISFSCTSSHRDTYYNFWTSLFLIIVRYWRLFEILWLKGIPWLCMEFGGNLKFILANVMTHVGISSNSRWGWNNANETQLTFSIPCYKCFKFTRGLQRKQRSAPYITELHRLHPWQLVSVVVVVAKVVGGYICKRCWTGIWKYSGRLCALSTADVVKFQNVRCLCFWIFFADIKKNVSTS